jgi:16S rRNA (guanine527-N7)-methyltransferase
VSASTAIIEKYFKLTDRQKEQFAMLPELYSSWNERINVISRKDIEQLMERHVLHSLALAHYFKLKPGITVLDVGTGGGFPGIPLAIYFPEVKFTLIDSIGKKITVVKEISEALGLTNVEAMQARAESVKGPFDMIVSRAVAPFPEIFNWVKGKVYKNPEYGIACLKGGDLQEELKPFSGKIKVYHISSVFEEEFFETKKVVFLASAGSNDAKSNSSSRKK